MNSSWPSLEIPDGRIDMDDVIEGDDLSGLTAVEIAAAVAEGRLTPERVADACLAHIAARDAALKAWIFVDPAAVRAQARQLAGRPGQSAPQGSSALHGVPIGIKDVIDTGDMPTCYNSPIFDGHHPALDAACVDMLRAAGGLIVGKTETTEFAAGGRYPRTRNPHDLTRTSGGSSAGSAAAVADGHVPLALGTQTGGSTMRPASYCGVFALKPTWGLVSREGIRIFSVSLDTISWFARNVPDLELLADVFGIGEAGGVSPSIAGLRIAFCRSPQWPAVEAPMREAFTTGREALLRAGAAVTDLELPPEFAALPNAHDTIARREGGAAFRSLYVTHKQELHEDFRGQVENRDGFTDTDLRDAYNLAARCRETFDALASEFDGILTPSAAGEAPSGPHPGHHVMNQIWSLLHVPCINLPKWRSAAGLPLGLTLVGPRFSDRRLLRVAKTLDAALDRGDGARY
jgi:Asp-tRNA(Asn)/Glu-tRNA(Gln) amidotransferase A subunit family amidase